MPVFLKCRVPHPVFSPEFLTGCTAGQCLMIQSQSLGYCDCHTGGMGMHIKIANHYKKFL